MSFPKLPVEVLHLIFTDCSVRDILALSSTCRSLRNACYRGSVFQDRTQRLLPRDAPSPLKLIARYVDTLDQAPDDGPSPTLVWYRVALAAEHLPAMRTAIKTAIKTLRPDVGDEETHLSESPFETETVSWYRPRPRLHTTKAHVNMGFLNEGNINERMARIISLLSMAIVWGYPSLCIDDLVDNLKSLCGLYCSPGHPQALEYALCLAVSCLGPEYWQYSAPRYGYDLLDHMTELTDGGGRNMRRHNIREAALYASKDIMTPEFWENDDPTDTRGTHIFLIIVAAMSQALQCLDADNPENRIKVPRPDRLGLLGRRAGSSEIEASVQKAIMPPLPDQVNTSPKSECPSRGSNPFNSLSWARWYREHVEALTRNICEGEWYGYSNQGSNEWEVGSVCVRGIRFQQLREEGEGDQRKLAVVAEDAVEGYDSYIKTRSRVLMTGQVALRRGMVNLRMSYGSNFRTVYIWRGQMTPVGISGYCYRPNNSTQTAGEFWLWRKDWMDESDAGIAKRTLDWLKENGVKKDEYLDRGRAYWAARLPPMPM